MEKSQVCPSPLRFSGMRSALIASSSALLSAVVSPAVQAGSYVPEPNAPVYLASAVTPSVTAVSRDTTQPNTPADGVTYSAEIGSRLDPALANWGGGSSPTTRRKYVWFTNQRYDTPAPEMSWLVQLMISLRVALCPPSPILVMQAE